MILITGISGFLGKSLINKLPKNEKYVFVSRKKIPKNNLNFKKIYSKNLFRENQNWWIKNLKKIDKMNYFVNLF